MLRNTQISINCLSTLIKKSGEKHGTVSLQLPGYPPNLPVRVQRSKDRSSPHGDITRLSYL